MSYSNRISIIDVPEKKSDGYRNNGVVQDVKYAKGADFEMAAKAAGYGWFHYLLFLAIIPVSWASSFDTANISMILPSAECDLDMTMFQKGVLNAIVYVGMVLSALLWGYVADIHGRKSVLIYGYFADGICNVLSGFSQNFETLVLFKFISGFIVSGPFASIMSYVVEFYQTSDRVRIQLMVGFSVSFGCIVNAVFAWMVVPQNWSIVLWDGSFVYNSWRIFLSLCGVPSLIGVICLSLFPESPRFLMSQGRNEEALEVFKLIYKVNTGRPANSYPISALKDETIAKPIDCDLSSDACHKSSGFLEGMRQIKPIFFSPHLCRLLLVVMMQFCGMLAVNTIRLWQPQLFTILDNYNPLDYNLTDSDQTFCEIIDATYSVPEIKFYDTADEPPSCENTIVADSVYMDSIIVSTSTPIFMLAAGILVNFFGQRYLLLISYGVSLLCLISMIWSVHALLTLVLACLFVGLMSTTVNIVIGATVILFPTSLRVMAVSMEMMVGRSGSIIGNVVFPVLLEYGCLAPIIALSSATSICIFLALLIPIARNGKLKA